MLTEVGDDRLHVRAVAACDEIEPHHVRRSLEVPYFRVSFAVGHYPQLTTFDQLVPKKLNLALTVVKQEA